MGKKGGGEGRGKERGRGEQRNQGTRERLSRSGQVTPLLEINNTVPTCCNDTTHTMLECCVMTLLWYIAAYIWVMCR